MPRLTAVPTPGTPCWMDLGTSDLARSADFYRALFGWTIEDQGEEFGHYHMATLDGRPMAGMMTKMPGDTSADGWMVYLAVANADDASASVISAGGSVPYPAMPVGPLGRMAIAVDRGGAMVGLWESGQHIGFGEVGEVATPVWFEDHTTTFGADSEFYREVFSYGSEMLADTDDFRYAQLTIDGEVVAGMMDQARDLPDSQGSHWLVYFGVADTDAAVARVKELGGTVLREPEDSPYGRLALVADPTGASFMITTIVAEPIA